MFKWTTDPRRAARQSRQAAATRKMDHAAKRAGPTSTKDEEPQQPASYFFSLDAAAAMLFGSLKNPRAALKRRIDKGEIKTVDVDGEVMAIVDQPN